MQPTHCRKAKIPKVVNQRLDLDLSSHLSQAWDQLRISHPLFSLRMRSTRLPSLTSDYLISIEMQATYWCKNRSIIQLAKLNENLYQLIMDLLSQTHLRSNHLTWTGYPMIRLMSLSLKSLLSISATSRSTKTSRCLNRTIKFVQNASEI